LVRSGGDADAAARAATDADRYPYGVAIVESRGLDRPLDRTTPATRDRDGIPSTQTRRYPSLGDDQSGDRIWWARIDATRTLLRSIPPDLLEPVQRLTGFPAAASAKSGTAEERRQ